MRDHLQPIEEMGQAFREIIQSTLAVKGERFTMATMGLFELSEVSHLLGQALAPIAVGEAGAALLNGVAATLGSLEQKLVHGLLGTDIAEARQLAATLFRRSMQTTDAVGRQLAL